MGQNGSQAMIIYQKWIHRVDLQANPDVMYLFGDNMQRIGMGGQAKEMRGEPNAHGIATKVFPTMADNAFFSDENFYKYFDVLLEDFAGPISHVMNGKTLVIPLDGLGTGLSQLPIRAPQLNKQLLANIKHLERISKRINS